MDGLSISGVLLERFTAASAGGEHRAASLYRTGSPLVHYSVSGGHTTATGEPGPPDRGQRATQNLPPSRRFPERPVKTEARLRRAAATSPAVTLRIPPRCRCIQVGHISDRKLARLVAAACYHRFHSALDKRPSFVHITGRKSQPS